MDHWREVPKLRNFEGSVAADAISNILHETWQLLDSSRWRRKSRKFGQILAHPHSSLLFKPCNKHSLSLRFASRSPEAGFLREDVSAWGRTPRKPHFRPTEASASRFCGATNLGKWCFRKTSIELMKSWYLEAALLLRSEIVKGISYAPGSQWQQAATSVMGTNFTQPLSAKSLRREALSVAQKRWRSARKTDMKWHEQLNLKMHLYDLVDGMPGVPFLPKTLSIPSTLLLKSPKKMFLVCNTVKAHAMQAAVLGQPGDVTCHVVAGLTRFTCFTLEREDLISLVI